MKRKDKTRAELAEDYRKMLLNQYRERAEQMRDAEEAYEAAKAYVERMAKHQTTH